MSSALVRGPGSPPAEDYCGRGLELGESVASRRQMSLQAFAHFYECIFSGGLDKQIVFPFFGFQAEGGLTVLSKTQLCFSSQNCRVWLMEISD